MVLPETELRELALFAGAGGGILGGLLLGWRTVCAVEINDKRRRMLLARQRDGILPRFPIWDDVTTFDGRFWKDKVDVVSGGFPCQDISIAGSGGGIRGSRSGLWTEMARIIGEVQPAYVLVENSPMLLNRGIDVVLGDLACLGYDARWGVISAADSIWSLGYPAVDHERKRIWIVGEASDTKKQGAGENHRGVWPGVAGIDSGENTNKKVSDANFFDDDDGGHGAGYVFRKRGEETELPSSNEGSIANGTGCTQQCGAKPVEQAPGATKHDSWWSVEPGMARMAHGVPRRVDRLEALGDGQVPAVVRLAWSCLKEERLW